MILARAHSTANAPGMSLQDRAQYLHQFVLHAALDAVDEQVWTTTAMHLGQVRLFQSNLLCASVAIAHGFASGLHPGRVYHSCS